MHIIFRSFNGVCREGLSEDHYVRCRWKQKCTLSATVQLGRNNCKNEQCLIFRTCPTYHDVMASLPVECPFRVETVEAEGQLELFVEQDEDLHALFLYV